MSQQIVTDMGWSIDSGLRRGAAVTVALSLIVVAAALIAYAIDERNTADFVRTLHLPGNQLPDTSTFDGLSVGALTEAIVALLTAAAAWFLRGRGFFAISAMWSVLALGTGAWIALETTPRLESIAVGPIQVSMASTGVVLAIAAAVCCAASIVGWAASPSERRPPRSQMPPPTHQA